MFEKVINELKESKDEEQSSSSDEDQEVSDAKRLGKFLFNAKGIDK